MIAIVAACSRNRVIGLDGRIPWHLPADLRRFRRLTEGHTVLMGRKTFESLPSAFQPLPNRRNIVLSTRHDFEPAAGTIVCPSLADGLRASGDGCFVIGGDAVFRAALPLAERVYLTEVDFECHGDAFFPRLGPEWRCIDEAPCEQAPDAFYQATFRTYDRAA